MIGLADSAHADQAMRLFACGKPGVALGTLQQRPLLHQFINDRFPVEVLVFGLVDGEREFTSGTGEMIFENVFIGGINDGVFDTAVEELHWVLHEVLVERVFGGDEDDQRLAAGAANAAGALPGIDDRAGIADQHAYVKAADVDAEFQCRGGNHAQ